MGALWYTQGLMQLQLDIEDNNDREKMVLLCLCLTWRGTSVPPDLSAKLAICGIPIFFVRATVLFFALFNNYACFKTFGITF